MAFKSEIHVAELASIRTGHTEGDIYYILDNGMLGDLPCKPGTFVKWHNDAWQIQPDEHYALASTVDGEIAQAIEIHDGGSKTESDLVEGVLTIASTNSVTKLTLTTEQTLTVLANDGVPNFALEIDNTGNSNDVTVTVKDSTGTTTLKASAAGGNTIDDGAYVQLTCVGGCWTMAVFS